LAGLFFPKITMTRRKAVKRCNTSPSAEATPTDDGGLHRKVEELSEEVTRQRNVINVLTQRLSFMLSMFGIDDGVLLNDDCNADGDGSASEVKITSGSATSGNAMNG